MLTACMPLYLPPAPDPGPAQVRDGLTEASSLEFAGRSLVLTLTVETLSAEGWLAVQWLRPNGSEAASESVWLEQTDAGRQVVFTLPAEIELVTGDWRVVVSLNGRLLRQFRAAVGA